MEYYKEFSANYLCAVLCQFFHPKIFNVFYAVFFYISIFFFPLQLLGADYLLILLFYLLLAFTGIFAFAHLNDLYTLNFQPDRCKDVDTPMAIYCLQVIFDFWNCMGIG